MIFRNKDKCIFFLCFLVSATCFPQNSSLGPTTFAVISDTHIGKPGNDASLKTVVQDINRNPSVDFIICSGDISDFGRMDQLKKAKSILDNLEKPYMIIPGNHDTMWSDNAGLAFTELWGDQKFIKDIDGIRFIGLSTGPYTRMTTKGYVPKDQVYWLDSIAAITPPDRPVVLVTHIPLADKYVSNFREVLSKLRNMHVIMSFCGHGHSNKIVNEDGFKCLMTTTTQLRNGHTSYNLITLSNDSLSAKAIYPISKSDTLWTTQAIMQKNDIIKELSKGYGSKDGEKHEVDKVNVIWDFQDKGNIISTPAVSGHNILFGNIQGEFKSIDTRNSKVKWKFNASEAIYSSPSLADGKVVFASADSTIYCLNINDGTQLWKLKTGAPVIASPIIKDNVVYIGGSDGKFRAIYLKSGEIKWTHKKIDGFVASKPSIAEGKIIFGTWNKKLYALNLNDGSLSWFWENNSHSAYYSPAICIPVIHDGVVYIVSPDEKLRGFDIKTGEEIFKIEKKGLRESLGGNAKNNRLLAKTMDGSIIAWNILGKDEAPKMFIHIPGDFGTDLSPSMPIMNNDYSFFGTASGKVYSIDMEKGEIDWIRPISNNMVNTLTFFSKNTVLASSIDGRIMLLKQQKN